MENEHDIEKGNRANFHSAMYALSRPGNWQPLVPLFDSSLLAMASVLLYAEVTYYAESALDFQLIEAVCGSHPRSRAEADYLFFTSVDGDHLYHAKVGSAENPELGATLIFQTGPSNIPATLSGPGIDGSLRTELPLSHSFVQALARKNDQYPQGVDLFLVDRHNQVLGLPRTTRIEVSK